MNAMHSISCGLSHKRMNAHLASCLLKPTDTVITAGTCNTEEKNAKLSGTLETI